MDFFALGRRIRTERQKRHYSQASLAEKLDVSTNFVGQIERADRKPSLDTLVNICNVFDTSLDYLLSDSLDSNNDPLMTDIKQHLQKFSHEELLFIYNTILSFEECQSSQKHYKAKKYK